MKRWRITEIYFIFLFLTLVMVLLIIPTNIFALQENQDEVVISDFYFTSMVIIGFIVATLSAFVVHNDVIKYDTSHDIGAGGWTIIAFFTGPVGLIMWLIVRKNKKKKIVANITRDDINELKIPRNTASLGVLEYFMWLGISTIFIIIPLTIIDTLFPFLFTNEDNDVIAFAATIILILIWFVVAPVCASNGVLTRPLLRREYIQKKKEEMARKIQIEKKKEEREEFERKQKEKGLVKFVGSDKKEKWATPEQVKKWKEELIELERKKKEEEIRKKKELQKLHEGLEQDLKNNRFDESLVLIVKKNVGLWSDLRKEKKVKTMRTFQSQLSKIYGFSVDDGDTSKFWNKIYHTTPRHKLIDLQSEIKKLGESTVSQRLDACKRLGMLKDRKAVRPLLEALKDHKLEVQVASAKALSEIGDPRALEDIRKLDNTISNKITKINNKINSLYKKNISIYNTQALEMRKLEISGLNREKKPLSDAHKILLGAINKLKKIKFAQMAKITENNLRKMDWQDFQDRVVEELGGVPSDKKVADMGIDGITSSGIPIQVKQSENVGRNVVDNFETALRRYYPTSKKIKKGIIVAFSFTKGAYNEAQRAHLEDKIKIDLVTAEELIE